MPYEINLKVEFKFKVGIPGIIFMIRPEPEIGVSIGKWRDIGRLRGVI